MKKLVEGVKSKWARLVILILASVNVIGWVLGYQLIPFTDEEIAKGISIVALVFSEVINHYKNNNYSKEAKKTQVHLDNLKKRKKKGVRKNG